MVPEWAKGAVVYQIFPDRFCNGDRENDVKTGEYVYGRIGEVVHADNWSDPPEALDVHRFYGGDLEGVWDKLPYLKELGVEVLLFNPIFRSPSNHKYDTTDYYEIDPHLTSRHARNQEDPGRVLSPNEYFAYFTRAVHEAGMRIVLDGVFNHCGSENAWCSDPAKADYFVTGDDGKRVCWWGVETLPKLNYKCAALREEIKRIGAYWVSEPYMCDGWRLDVAGDLGESPEENHAFWREFSDAVKAARPDAWIFAEHYGDASKWVKSGEWDSVMNYEGFMEPVSWFFTGVDKHCDKADPSRIADARTLSKELKLTRTHFTDDAYLAALNQLDNHDHARYTTRTAGRCGRLASEGAAAASEGVRRDVLMASVVFQMTWPGAPGIYYGDETGICGWTDPDSRRTYPWGSEDFRLIDFYKNAAALHRGSAALRLGATEIIYAQKGCFAFVRSLEGEIFLTAVNRSEKTLDTVLELPGRKISAAERILTTEGGAYNVGRRQTEVSNGQLPLELPPVSAVVLRLETGDPANNSAGMAGK